MPILRKFMSVVAGIFAGGLVVAAVEAAEVALVNTTEQLESLRQAGVVDAGGAGLVIVLQSLRRVVESGGGPVRPLTEPPAWLTEEAAVLTTDCGDDDEDGVAPVAKEPAP